MATYLWSTIMRLPFLGILKLKFVILYQPFWDPILCTPESQQKGMLVNLMNLLAVDIDDDNSAQELCRVSLNLWITI